MAATTSDPLLWFRISQGLNELLQAGGITERDNYTLDDINIGLREYIKSRRLYDVKQKKVVNCEKDLIGKVFCVSSFTANDFVNMLSANIVLSKSEPRPIPSSELKESASVDVKTHIQSSNDPEVSSDKHTDLKESCSVSRKRTNSGDSFENCAKRPCDEAVDNNPVITKHVDVHDYASTKYKPKAPPQVVDWPYGTLCVPIPDPLLHVSSAGEESDYSYQGYDTMEDKTALPAGSKDDSASEAETEENATDAEFSEEYTIHSNDEESDRGLASDNKVQSDSSSCFSDPTYDVKDLATTLKRFMQYDTEFMADKDDKTDSELDPAVKKEYSKENGDNVWVCPECCHENRVSFLKCGGCMRSYKPPANTTEFPSNCRLRADIQMRRRRPPNERRRRKLADLKNATASRHKRSRTSDTEDELLNTQPSSQESVATIDSGYSHSSSLPSTSRGSMDSSKISPCTLCFVNAMDSILVHRNTSHQMACYACSKRMWKNQTPCPICRKPILKVCKNYLSCS